MQLNQPLPLCALNPQVARESWRTASKKKKQDYFQLPLNLYSKSNG
jgi:hypothetical protein